MIMSRKGVEANLVQANVSSKAVSGQCVIVIDCWVSLCAQKSGKKGFTMQKGGISQSREVFLKFFYRRTNRNEKWSFPENGTGRENLIQSSSWNWTMSSSLLLSFFLSWKSGKKDLRCKKSITLHYSSLLFILNITIPWKQKGNGKRDKKG